HSRGPRGRARDSAPGWPARLRHVDHRRGAAAGGGRRAARSRNRGLARSGRAARGEAEGARAGEEEEDEAQAVAAHGIAVVGLRALGTSTIVAGCPSTACLPGRCAATEAPEATPDPGRWATCCSTAEAARWKRAARRSG